MSLAVYSSPNLIHERNLTVSENNRDGLLASMINQYAQDRQFFMSFLDLQQKQVRDLTQRLNEQEVRHEKTVSELKEQLEEITEKLEESDRFISRIQNELSEEQKSSERWRKQLETEKVLNRNLRLQQESCLNEMKALRGQLDQNLIRIEAFETQLTQNEEKEALLKEQICNLERRAIEEKSEVEARFKQERRARTFQQYVSLELELSSIVDQENEEVGKAAIFGLVGSLAGKFFGGIPGWFLGGSIASTLGLAATSSTLSQRKEFVKKEIGLLKKELCLP